ncbi:glycosyltransferase family 1 protein [Photobacterium sp. TLY01]|uniref:glycosyltransferase family 1 protein n=1 Tax=Photobacterium sp. TLY01 TaxID=2907534 RepID=UPI001F484C6C|nr:glycosyltransferase family 1 protein [Photobacterium sp. TLY01]UIP27225.1 glycosyltransferase family 1 protein [Photobacterium sp. TLY01]
MKNIIFHHPLPLDEKSKSASGIRPLRMLSAFRELGYEVDLVVGYSKERKKAIEEVKGNIKAGKKYDFVYAESSTMPNVLTDPHHLPLHPFLDWFFFRFCKKNDIPIGLFYRDIYWCFDAYGAGLNFSKVIVAKAAYRFDLWIYKRNLAKLYLPSEEMGKYIPTVSSDIHSPLPPGHTLPDVETRLPYDKDKKLKLFYVGGMSNHYQLHKLFCAVVNLPNIELTVCTREAEWLGVKHEYPDLTPNIKIVHLSGVEMEKQLNQSDIAVLFVKPQEYWKFASPVKLYEYLGYRKPILASEGTLAGKFVSENRIGWTLPYDVESVSECLQRLSEKSDATLAPRLALESVSLKHSWQARALQVVKELSK